MTGHRSAESQRTKKDVFYKGLLIAKVVRKMRQICSDGGAATFGVIENLALSYHDLLTTSPE